MKKNIVFYCHNFWWLWHTRRLSLIISEIINNFWDYYNVIFLNSWIIQEFLFKNIKGVKIINLPNYKIVDYKIVDWEKVFIYRKNIFERLFSIWNIEKLIVEHYPFGRNFLNNEIRYLISCYKNYNKNWFVFSSVRDIFDLKALNNKNLDLFDRFLIHGDKNIINYKNIFPENIENKFIYTWYVIDKLTPNRKNEDFILVSLWWWQDWFEYVIKFLSIYKSLNVSYRVLINLWLNYKEENLLKINELWVKDIEITDYFEDFLDLKKKAKLIVSMWWYNNFIENIFYDKVSLIYPRESDDEQQIRLNIFKWIFKNIIDAREIDAIGLEKILFSNKFKNNTKIDFNWAYFSASFIFNYFKYKYIKIRLTNACNAKCSMCWVIKRELKYNNLDNLKKSIIDFYKLWWSVINFTWGEPTIYNWFWDLLKLSKRLWLTTSVSTNWSTLWDCFFENLYFNWIKLIDYIDISIDWLYDLHDKIRSYKGLFKIIDSYISRILENAIYLHINITIRKDNINEMVNIFNYLKNKNVNSISFWMIASDPLNDTSKLIPSIDNLEKLYKINKQYILKNKWNIKIIFSPNYDDWDFVAFAKSIHNKNAFPKKQWEKCFFINKKNEIRINEWWDISPCCIIDDFDEGLWCINREELLSIVCSKKYENFLNRTFPNISKACLNCKIEI